MRELAIFILFLVTGFSLMIGLSILAGRIQPAPERVEKLHLMDCAPPCWAGIVPGVSSSAQAQARIGQLFPKFIRLPTGDANRLMRWQHTGPNRVATFISILLKEGMVADMMIETDIRSETMPSLGDLSAIYGAPLCVTNAYRSGYALAIYENAAHQATLQVMTYPLSLASPLNRIVFGADNFTCHQLSTLSWYDFRRYEHSLLLTS